MTTAMEMYVNIWYIVSNKPTNVTILLHLVTVPLAKHYML